MRLTRRGFLRLGAAVGGGLMVGVRWPEMLNAVEGTVDSVATAELASFVEVSPDGGVTIVTPSPEIGQGVRTAQAMIVADELRADWTRVRVRQASSDPRYGSMAVGGSDSIADYWHDLRTAGAAAREMLIAVAAARWNVSRDACHAQRSEVVHAASGRRLGFGALAHDASQMSVPTDVSLLEPSEFQLIGTRVTRVGLDDIVMGRAEYGLDVRVRGMLVACIERAPSENALLSGYQDAAALKVPGVVRVIEVKPLIPDGHRYSKVRSGVAVLARDTWAAMRGREVLETRWDAGTGANDDTEQLRVRMGRALEGAPAKVLREEGDVTANFASARRVIEAEYELPLLAHGSLEPQNFTARVNGEQCEAWGPTQHPMQLRRSISIALNIPARSVHVHPTLEGGGFGRRLSVDYGVEAAVLARAAGVPVQVVWTREDDFRHDYFRTASRHRLRATVRSGRVAGWDHHFTATPLLDHIVGPGANRPEIYDVEGAANLPYAIPNLRVSFTPVETGLQLGSWRSVAHSFNVFVVNSFLDELSVESKRDPLEHQLDLLGEPRVVSIRLPYEGRRGRPTWDTGRMRRVLEAAARQAGWGRAMPAMSGQGLAVCYFKRTYCATVAEVEVQDGKVRVLRVVTAIDCGRVINPDGVEAQVEGAAMDGAASVLHWGIHFDEGRVRERGFDDYPLLRIDEAPRVETVIIASDAPPSGTGEPPYPAVPPAITNAIFSATGKRVRRLPVDPEDLK